MASPERHLTGGRLNAALANAVMRIHSQYVGRGPTKGQAFFRHNVVVVVMEDTLTKAERSLGQDGKHDAVLGMRQQFQRTMAADLISAVEELTGCIVTAFMSDNHIEPGHGSRAVRARPARPQRATSRTRATARRSRRPEGSLLAGFCRAGLIRQPASATIAAGRVG